jgi:hypothetical protein
MMIDLNFNTQVKMTLHIHASDAGAMEVAEIFAQSTGTHDPSAQKVGGLPPAKQAAGPAPRG